MELISLIVSALALSASIFTVWYTVIRRGEIKCTRPSIIAFKYDFVGKDLPQAKIFLRTLLHSTGKRGIVIENLFLRVHEGDRSEEFSIWGYGERGNLVQGGGLFVGESGFVAYHHFNPINSKKPFRFTPGIYELELVAQLVGRERLAPLFRTLLKLDAEITPNMNIVFNWSAEQKSYVSEID